MNYKNILFTGLLLCVLTISVTEGRKNKGRGRNNGEKNTTECLGESVKLPRLLEGFNDCTDEMVPQSEFPEGASDDDKIVALKNRKKAIRKNQMCVKLCQRKKQGILDSEGSFSKTGAETFVTEMFPQKARTRMQRGMQRCAEDNGEKFEVSDQCKEYRRFEKCLMRVISKTCGWKNGKGKPLANFNRRVNKGRKGNKGKNQKGHGADMSEENHEDEDTETEAVDI